MPSMVVYVASVLLTVSLVVPSVFAIDTSGSTSGERVLIPIVGRTAGAEGSFWKTDVMVTNVWRVGPPVDVTLWFYWSGQPVHVVAASIAPLQTVSFPDFVGGSVGLREAVGLVLVETAGNGARISARARVYDSAPGGGEYGLSIPGFPPAKLPYDTVLAGLDGTSGRRANLGLSNPVSRAAEVMVSLFDGSGVLVGERTTTVEPHSVKQVIDVFAWFDVPPFADGTILVSAGLPHYAFLSIVEPYSGDPQFVLGISDDPDVTNEEVTPPCEAPAPLSLASNPAPGFIIVYHKEIDVVGETYRLARKYRFRPASIYDAVLGGFAARVWPEVLAQIRCEPSVRFVEQNVYVSIPGGR